MKSPWVPLEAFSFWWNLLYPTWCAEELESRSCVSKNLLLSDAAIGSVSQHAKALQIEPSLKVPKKSLFLIFLAWSHSFYCNQFLADPQSCTRFYKWWPKVQQGLQGKWLHREAVSLGKSARPSSHSCERSVRAWGGRTLVQCDMWQGQGSWSCHESH